jgi:RNA polymerase sigma-70 factor (ECF subfamily)
MDVAALYERHHAELYRYAARFTGDPDLAEDVVQEAFVRLAERPPRDRSRLRAWLFRVATTVARDALRTARRRQQLAAAHVTRVPAADPAPDPGVAVERAELRARVRAALDELEPRERVVLLMCEEGFRHREVAEAVGTTEKSVGTMFARALAKLAARLDLDAEDAR